MVKVTGHRFLNIEESVFTKYIKERRYRSERNEMENDIDQTNFLCYLGVFDEKVSTFAEYYKPDIGINIYINFSDLLATLSEFRRIRHLKYVLSFGKVIIEHGFWDYCPEVLETYNAFIVLHEFIKKHQKRVKDRKLLEKMIRVNKLCDDIHEIVESFL